MKTNKSFFAMLSISLPLISGCFSTPKHDLRITAIYPFEGRYDSSNIVSINDNKISFAKEDSIWILSNNTLGNLLISVSEDKEKIIFKANRSYSILEEFNNFKKTQNDEFDNEEYVWDGWIISK